jgi:hypothetical protein
MKFISKANFMEDTKKGIYITATPSSKKILKEVGFVFKYYQVDTRDKTSFTFSFGVYTPKEGKKLIKDAIYLDIR